jgi:molybdopterin-guanine dinucleotide biosynthesis protein A
MGQPKAWLPFSNEFLLQRIVRTVQEVVDPVIVVAAPDQGIPELSSNVTIIHDEIEGRGPLQGLASGLRELTHKVDYVYLSSCDVPFLKAGFVKRVVSILLQDKGGVNLPDTPMRGLTSPTRSEIAVPRVGNRFHPLAAVYSTSVLPQILKLLAADQLRLTSLFDIVSTRVIEQNELTDVDPEFDSLRNLNTPEDYDAALHALMPNRSE